MIRRSTPYLAATTGLLLSGSALATPMSAAIGAADVSHCRHMQVHQPVAMQPNQHKVLPTHMAKLFQEQEMRQQAMRQRIEAEMARAQAMMSAQLPRSGAINNNMMIPQPPQPPMFPQGRFQPMPPQGAPMPSAPAFNSPGFNTPGFDGRGFNGRNFGAAPFPGNQFRGQYFPGNYNSGNSFPNFSWPNFSWPSFSWPSFGNFPFGSSNYGRAPYGYMPYRGMPQAAPAPAPEPVEAKAAPADDDRDGVINTADFCPDTAAGTQVDGFGCAASDIITLEGVNFHTNSDELTETSLGILDGVAKTLIANPDVAVEIAGHTDSQGDAGYNLDLSDRRAKSVVAYLSDAGVLGDNMTAKGYGETQPVADNASKEGRAKNRRVELRRLDQASTSAAPPAPVAAEAEAAASAAAPAEVSATVETPATPEAAIEVAAEPVIEAADTAAAAVGEQVSTVKAEIKSAAQPRATELESAATAAEKTLEANVETLQNAVNQ